MKLHRSCLMWLFSALHDAPITPALGAIWFWYAVYDPTAVGQLISQVSNQVKMLNQMVQQVQQGQSMLSALPGNNIVPALASLMQQSQLLVNNLSNIGSLGGSLTGDLNSQYPTDFSSLPGVSQHPNKTLCHANADPARDATVHGVAEPSRGQSSANYLGARPGGHCVQWRLRRDFGAPGD